jgi:hypothetical protein
MLFFWAGDAAGDLVARQKKEVEDGEPKNRGMIMVLWSWSRSRRIWFHCSSSLLLRAVMWIMAQ